MDSEPIPANFPATWLAGAALFNEGQWWEAHEAWETEWARATGERRAALQALILLAAALHKRWRMGSLTGRNFLKAQVYMGRLSPEAFGVDWTALEAEVGACLGRSQPEPLPVIAFSE